MTVHNEAKLGDFGKYVLMPGDPLRAKYIADNFLENVKQVNGVRNMLAFSGEYKGVKVSVMGGGMGIPSIGIYSYELYKFYDVECIIRVGSAGSYVDDLSIFDVFVVDKAYSESTYPIVQSGDESLYQYPQGDMNDYLISSADKVKVGCVHSSDVFYNEDSEYFRKVSKEHGCQCVDMESVALFHNAKILGKSAATILTISDSLINHEQTTAKERECSFNNMINITLDAIYDRENKKSL